MNTHQHGGAARAAIRLHEGLCSIGEDSSMMVRFGKESSKVTVYQQNPSLLCRVRRRLRREKIIHDFSKYRDSRPKGLEIFSDDRSEYASELMFDFPETDIINLHWVNQFVDYTTFFRNVKTPVVWTLHDMNPFTGGCHYAGGCMNFQGICGFCPQLGSNREQDLSRKIWKRKKKALSQVSSTLHIVTPSQWLKKQVQASFLFKDLPVSLIPNALDTAVFTPKYVTGFKSSIGIPEHAKVVLFAADSLDNKRKGFALLLQVIQGIQRQENIYFLSIGGGAEGSQLPNHVHLGNITSDYLMSVVYSIADVFVIPSLEDNLPNTVLESMACGTPVIGFDLGGMPDMIHAGKTGILVEPKNILALREAVLSLLGDMSLLSSMSRQCRDIAQKEYHLTIQSKRYLKLYRKLLSKRGVL